MNEIYLIENAQRGDASSAEELIKQYKGLVCKLARRYFLASYDTDDLIQEGTIGLLRALREYDCASETDFTNYAARCIRSALTDCVRAAYRKKRRTESDAISMDDEENRSLLEAAAAASPLDNFIAEESDSLFFRKLEELLAPNEYAVIKLYLDGFSYKEIASILAFTIKKVDNAVFSAKRKLKNKLTLTLDKTLLS